MGTEYKTYLKESGIYECRECSLANRRRGVCVYRGVPGNPVMVIGEAPGDQEDKQGKPMVGMTGSYLVNLFAQNGLTLYDHLYITNTVLCHPPADRDPTEDELEACSYWLNRQIEINRPRFIITAGRIATSRIVSDFMKGSRITDFEGKEFILPHYNHAVCIPLRHPSAIMRAPTSKPDYENMVSRISNIIKRSLEETPHERKIYIQQS